MAATPARRCHTRRALLRRRRGTTARVDTPPPGEAPPNAGAGTVTGLSPVLAPRTSGLAIGDLELLRRGMYSSGALPGHLKSTQPHLEAAEAIDLKAAWMKQHGGARRSIAVLNATTDFNPIQISPIDSALDTARQWSLRDTALAFGCPPYMLGVPGDSSTYANVENRMIELRAFTLLPWCRRIESTLDAQFPRGTTMAKSKRQGSSGQTRKPATTPHAVGITGEVANRRRRARPRGLAAPHPPPTWRLRRPTRPRPHPYRHLHPRRCPHDLHA